MPTVRTTKSLHDLTGGRAPPPERFVLPVHCGGCGVPGHVPFEPPRGSRWRGPRSWFDVLTPALKGIGWALSVSTADDPKLEGVWFSLPMCPMCSAKVVGTDEAGLEKLLKDGEAS